RGRDGVPHRPHRGERRRARGRSALEAPGYLLRTRIRRIIRSFSGGEHRRPGHRGGRTGNRNGNSKGGGTMKARFALAALGLAALALVALVAGCKKAEAPYYEGKTITIVVGYKPGGGYDATARLLSRYLPKYIPGTPTVIVQNMPGANSLIAANYVYAQAKPDGLTIGTFNRNLPIGQLLAVEGVKFDMLKFAWIGSAASETTVLAIRNDLPYKTFDDLKKAKDPIVVGATGPGANTYDFPLLLKEFLGVNLKLV